MSRDCRSKDKTCTNCDKKGHHSSICKEKTPDGIIGESPALKSSVKSPAAEAYQTLQVIVRSPDGGKKIRCRALLDSAGGRTFFSQKLADQLKGKPICQDIYQVEGIMQRKEMVKFEVHHLEIEGIDRKYKKRIMARTLPEITVIGNPSPINLKKKYEHLRDLYFNDVTQNENLEIDLLIGTDYLVDILTGEVRKGKEGEPIAFETYLGWTVMGKTGLDIRGRPLSNKTTRNLVVEKPATIKDDVNKLCDLETIGVREEDPIEEAFSEEIQFTGKRYSVKLPWREGNFYLPNNRVLAEGRLKSQLRKLRKTPEILEAYDGTIKEQLKEGIIEEVPEKPTGGRITYLPHQEIVRKDAETTKVRVVYDASAKPSKNARSLNECLYVGPSLTPLLYDVLL